MAFVRTLLAALRHRQHHRRGVCPVCGHRTLFVCRNPGDLRNDLLCLFCRSIARNRLVAELLLAAIAPGTASLAALPRSGGPRIYSASANDAFARVLRRCATARFSEFVPGIRPGAPLPDRRPRATCEDLERLSFAGESFDAVVTQDVFEHVRDPERGFREVRRVLRRGGVHVFTVPYLGEGRTLVRVDTSGPEDRHLLPEEWHGDPVRGRILSYRTFGSELLGQLAALGMPTEVRYAPLGDCAFVSRRS
jgi:SAM-dependent methyltransferase